MVESIEIYSLELPDYVWDEYDPTPIMPSYLVALMVSDFVNVTSDPELSPGVVFNMWTRPGHEKQTLYVIIIYFLIYKISFNH